MIPISKDQTLRYEVDGVVYLLRPPIGEMEVQLQTEHLNDASDDDYKKTKRLYPVAVKELESDYKGQRKPKKEQWNKLIENKINEMIAKERLDPETVKKNAVELMEKTDRLIDDIMIGWETKIKGVPPFPKQKPSELLVFPLKSRITNWYWEQYTLTKDELVN